MNGQTFILKVENARPRMKAAWDFACRFLELDKPAIVTVKEFKKTRSLEQNDKFHAVCHDISQQRQWAGVWLDTEGWKRLLIDAWARATGRTQGKIVPSLDGESIVNLSIQSRSLSVQDMAELIDFAEAWCGEHEVKLHDGK